MKRFFDLFIALFAMILLMPIISGAIILIFLSDGLPVFYMQERVGKNGKIFNLYKLRSMKNGSEKFGFTTLRNDERVFPAGKFIRRYKIDEMPQLLNILLGEMSIVGPRPTVLEDYNIMTAQQKKRCDVVPGLTGLAQISGNTSLLWPKRIRLDLEYINKQSFVYDLNIIIKTFFLVISNKIDSESNDDGEW